MIPGGSGDLLAQIQARKKAQASDGSVNSSSAAAPKNALLASLQKRQATVKSAVAVPGAAKPTPPKPTCPDDKIFHYDSNLGAFLMRFASTNPQPELSNDPSGNAETDILIPLAPCAYRLTDYTLAKKEPIALSRCLLKLGVLRCLQRERDILNKLLWQRLSPSLTSLPNLVDAEEDRSGHVGSIEEEELGKMRFMELLSNCGVYQKVSELILNRAGKASDLVHSDNRSGKGSNPYRIPQVKVEGLDEFLHEIEKLTPSLNQARQEIQESQTVSFYPGLGELFTPGSQLVCFPDGMEGVASAVSVVQSWYAEEVNKATNKVKRRFVLVVEFVVSVGTELVFVAASEIYPEFHDPSRNVPIKDLTHRKLLPDTNSEDASLLARLQQRGEFYASIATSNVFVEYMPNSFYPIVGGGFRNNATRPLSKGGRVMVDVKRGILENHLPVRGSADGMSDTVKEAIKLFEQNKRTGIAVPFRTAILPEFDVSLGAKRNELQGGYHSMADSDRKQLWQAWPCVVGFSFTSRVWGKLLLTLPKASPPMQVPESPVSVDQSPRRASMVKHGVQRAALGGVGKCGSCGFIHFQEQAFEQLVLAEDKKELIRAVARNAGGEAKFDSYDDDDDDAEEDLGLDVIANKGAASIFLLNGPPGCGKTLTAEAIAELLKKPLYVVTAGDLGITASEVEKTLGSVLELCQTWDALVLIDEADIFLEARSSTEIQRNALVCVMLRLLEYYSGCLFLSSNRASSSIDAAIASRITVMLEYPPLDATGRAKVWKNLVGLVPVTPIDPETGTMVARLASNPRKASRYRIDFAESDYRSLADEYQINGRQIKNSIVLARALARERGVPLSLPILHRAVTAVAGESVSSKVATTNY